MRVAAFLRSLPELSRGIFKIVAMEELCVLAVPHPLPQLVQSDVVSHQPYVMLLADHIKVPLNLLLFVKLLHRVASFGRRYVRHVFQFKRLQNNVICSEGEKLEHLNLMFK
jgi:hypothetical protein